MLLAFPITSMTSDRPGGSVSQVVAAAVEVVRESGLPYETTSMFTIIGGEWGEVMSVVKRCVDAVAERPLRILLVAKADVCPGYTGQIITKVERVNGIPENRRAAVAGGHADTVAAPQGRFREVGAAESP